MAGAYKQLVDNLYSNKDTTGQIHCIAQKSITYTMVCSRANAGVKVPDGEVTKARLSLEEAMTGIGELKDVELDGFAEFLTQHLFETRQK